MNIKNINNNPISKAWKERYSKQPSMVKEKLDCLNQPNTKDYQLRISKKQTEKIKKGDVFLLSPRENVYFYGKVLDTDIKHKKKDIFIEGKNLVFIFKFNTPKINLDNYQPNYDELLISPAIVDKSYWKQGLFYTIGNEKITEEEKHLDYGFYSIVHGKFYKEDGTELGNQPEYIGTYGLATITGIALQIEKEIIITPDILKIKK